MWSFGNGVCDPECDSEDALYDGFDCEPATAECGPSGDRQCRNIFANGVCDMECDSPGCVWDGGDCISKPLDFARDIVVLTLAKWYQLAGKPIDVKELGRMLSKLLHTLVRVLPDSWQGEHMRPETQGGAGLEQHWHKPDRRGYMDMRRIYLKIDNTQCQRRCFRSAEYAAQFIALSIRNGWDPGIPITSVGGQ